MSGLGCAQRAVGAKIGRPAAHESEPPTWPRGPGPPPDPGRYFGETRPWRVGDTQLKKLAKRRVSIYPGRYLGETRPLGGCAGRRRVRRLLRVVGAPLLLGRAVLEHVLAHLRADQGQGVREGRQAGRARGGGGS